MLYEVNLTQAGTVKELISLLRACIPHSLPVLGTILHSDFSPSRFDPELNSNEYPLYVWVSFNPYTPGSLYTSAPSLFSVITLSPINSNQARYFCSAETRPESPTEEEKAHVAGCIKQLVNGLTPIPKNEQPDIQALYQDEVKIGSVHEKWLEILKPMASTIGPCTKYFRRPQSQPPSTLNYIDENLVVSGLQPSDIFAVMSTSHIPRSTEYLLSRCSTSSSIRSRDSNRLVAWVLQHSDGSIGTLYVEPEYRKKGLAACVVAELVKKLELQNGGQDGSINEDSEVDRGGAMGWNSVDVVEGNASAERFFERLDGWEKGWKCYWMTMTSK